MSIRRGFSLIEILIACILLGVGCTSVIGLLLVALGRARTATAQTTMGPLATAAATYVAMHRLLPGSSWVDLPDAGGAFQSPFALRVDSHPAGAAGATTADPDPWPPDADMGSDTSALRTYRIRVYDSAERRTVDKGRLGTMYVRIFMPPVPGGSMR